MARHKALATLALLAVLAPSTGCYFGRSSRAKSGAYLANSALIVVGGASMLSAKGSSCSPDADISCGLGSGLANGAANGLGALLALGGAIGLAANLMTPTTPTHPEPAPKPSPVTPAPTTFTLTAPGLTPATITR